MVLNDLDLTKLSWESFACIRLLVECLPPQKIKDRGQLLTKLELEYRRRLELDLTPKDLPEAPPF